mmetsp:Transcript_68648/g.223367  ORF Transcript_68648/g.223367 Transcript_68648/m.223367 type:complete len:464 (+) Transcript_68648:111-1502(+)
MAATKHVARTSSPPPSLTVSSSAPADMASMDPAKASVARRLRRSETSPTVQEMRSMRSSMVRRHSLCHIQMGDGSRGHAFDLTDLKPLRRLRKRSSFLELAPELAPTPRKIQHLLQRARTRTDFNMPTDILEEDEEEKEGGGQPSYMRSAAMAMVLNVLSVLPYVKILAADPGSPMFISFVTHLFVVAINIHKAPKLFMNRQLPILYHVAFVGLAYVFNFLKGDSFARLPTAVAMVMMNLQMLVGMLVQGIFFRVRFSLGQVSGCAIVTLGVVLVGLSARKPSSSFSSGAAEADQSWQFLIGTVELLGGLAAVVFLSNLTKTAFSKYGECVDEQMFFQHLFGIPLFFIGSQWERIGPRISKWGAKGDWWLIGMLLSNLAFTFAGSKARVTFVGRAPNGLLVQLVETLTKFISLFATALLNAPPFPPMGFWGGSGVLVLGTLQFLTASDAPERDDDEEKDEKED